MRLVTRSSPRPASCDRPLGGCPCLSRALPIRDGAVEIDDRTGTIAAVGPREELSTRCTTLDSGILPLRELAHSPEYESTQASGYVLRFADWTASTSSAKLDRPRGHAASARLGVVNCWPGSPRGRLQLRGAAATACAELGLAQRSSSRCREDDGAAPEASCPARSARRPPLVSCAWASAHAPYTGHVDLTALCASSGRSGNARPSRATTEDRSCAPGRAAGVVRGLLLSPLVTTGIRAWRGGTLDSNVIAAHCVNADEEDIAPLRARLAVAHCPPQRDPRLRSGPSHRVARGHGCGLQSNGQSLASPLIRMFARCVPRSSAPAQAKAGRRSDGRRRERCTLGGSARGPGHHDEVGLPRPAKRRSESSCLADTSLSRGDPVTGTVLGGTHQSVRYSRVRKTAVREGREGMARADRRRAQSARPAAAGRRSEVVIEDTMFFPRLRRHAKWMFLFLALALGLGFVLFGIGAGGIGLGTWPKVGGASGVPSLCGLPRSECSTIQGRSASGILATAHRRRQHRRSDRGDGDFIALSRGTRTARELAALYLQQARRRSAQDLPAASDTSPLLSGTRSPAPRQPSQPDPSQPPQHS